MDRRHFLSLSLLTGVGSTAAGAVLSGCGNDTTSGSSAKPITVQLGDTVAENNPEIAAERHFGERLAKLTDNRIKVDVRPGGVLGDHNRMNDQVRNGTLQLTKTLCSNLTALDKRIGVLSLPYAFTRQDELFTALDGALGKELGKILDAADLVLLGFFDSGARSVYNMKRPIRTPADLAGIRLRVPQDLVSIDAFNTLGAQAMPMATNEIYSAMQKGVIDGAENNIIFYVTNKHVELATFWSWTRHQFGVDALLASKKWLTSLPKKDQDAVIQAGQETVTFERQLWKTQTDEYAADAKSRNVQINDDVDVAAFAKAVKPVLDKYRGTFGDLMKLLPLS